MSADLEDRLRRYGRVLDQAAEERAAGALPSTGARRLPTRRVLAAGTAAAVAAAALVVVGFVGGDDSGYRVRVAGEPQGADALDRGSDGAFPHLLIGGWKVSRADESAGPMADTAPSGGWYQVYRHPEQGYDAAQVTIHTLPPGANWGTPDDGRQFDAGSGRAVFYRSNDLQALVMWSPEGGRTVVVRGTRVDDDGLVEVVRGLRPRTGADGWEATVLPEGLVSVADGPDAVPERYRRAEVEFARGDNSLQLSMSEESVYALDDLIDDRVNSAAELRGTTVFGHAAAVTRYQDSQRHAAMWFADGVVYELDGDAGDGEAFSEALGDLRVVDADTWEAALPDNAVPPRERAAEVDRMLADIPQPPGFDPAPLRQGAAVSDRYQLGAKVSGAVACAWIDRWVEARRAGDEATVGQAADAMATSRDWQVLHDMNDEGDYPEVLWEYADAMANDGQVEGGKPMSVEESAPDALGCPR